MELTTIEPEHKEPTFREPLISFIVPAYNILPVTLKRCLSSLVDQDYPNVEIVVVLDGPNEALQKVAVDFPCEVIEIPHAGACAARNRGFEWSKGEIVSFFNSDYMAKPGMIRKWVDALLAHPEAGFVYGGYEYATAQHMQYPSKPFSPFLLDVANFIDCGFPLWRKYAVPWDVECKSLQDWDFWIRVVKEHNVSGFYLGAEPSFLAEPSGKPGGLSEDSHRNWIDRVHYIKSKNGIAEPELVVTSLGAAFHGASIARMLNADFRDDTLFKPNTYKAVYMIGFYNRGEDLKAHANVIAHFKQRENFKIILHFVGADIYWLRHRTYKDLKYLSGALNLQAHHILTENEQAQRELMDMGIRSEIVPIPPYSTYQVQPLPKEFRMATFLTEKSDFDKYCLEETLSIVRATPDIEWTGYGDAANQAVQYPNMKCVGNLSKEAWQEYVYGNSAIFRLVRHDTLPMAPCEFLLAGRDVLSNIPMKYANLIDTSGKLELNQWDIFQEGLNPYNWPRVKTDIVTKIRAIKRRQIAEQYSGDAHRKEVGQYYADLLSVKKYRDTIYSLANITEAK